MRRRVAIVGSRDFPGMPWAGETIETLLHREDVVISGGARGVDRLAVEVATRKGLCTVVHTADWSKGKGAGFARNQRIVDDAEIVFAFWDGTSRGTRDTIERAVRAKRLCYIFSPDRTLRPATPQR